MSRLAVSVLSQEEVALLGSGSVVVRDGVLGEERARALAEALADRFAGARPAGVGRGVHRHLDPLTRGDEIVWLEGPPLEGSPSFAETTVWSLFESLQGALNESVWLGLESFQVQLARYREPGSRYVRHRDAFGDPHNRRLATAIYYLNSSWRPEHGGCLRVYTEHGTLDVEPVLDRLVLFLSERVEHEVLPVAAPRLAVTAWFERRGLLPSNPDPCPPTQAA